MSNGDYQSEPHARLSLAEPLKHSLKHTAPTIHISMDCTQGPVQVKCDQSINLVISLTCGCRSCNLHASEQGKDAPQENIPMDSSPFVREQAAIKPVSFSWDEVVQAWSDDASRQQFSPVYIDKCVRALGRLKAFTGCERIEQIQMSTIREYLGHLEKHGAGVRNARGGVGAKTLNNYLTSYQSFFEWCKKNEYAPASWRNPCKDISPAKMIRKQARALKVNEALGIHRAALADERSEHPKSMHEDGGAIIRSGFYWVLICTGIRVSTAEHLRVKHFELDSTPAKIHIPAFNAGKNSRERTIVISDLDRDVLLEYFENHPKKLEQDDLALTRPQPRVLVRDATDAGVDVKDKQGRNLGFHCFRRFHATQLLRMKTDPKLVQQRLGHRDISTTMNHYNDVQDDDQMDVANALALELGAKKSALPLDTQRKVGYIQPPHHSEDGANPLPTEINTVNPPGIDTRPNDADQKPCSPTEVGDLPRSSEQEDQVRIRGLETLISTEGSLEREAIRLLTQYATILERMLDRR